MLLFVTGHSSLLLTTGSAIRITTALAPGSGKRVLLAGLDNLSRETAHVAITWVAINASTLFRLIRGERGVPSKLFSAKEDLKLFFTEPNLPMGGACGGAPTALSVVSWLTQCNFVTEHLGLTGVIDLRGRIFSVSGLPEKAKVAKEAGSELNIIPSQNYQELVSTGFSAIPEDLREYAMETFKGAATMVDVFRLSIPGES